MSETKLNSNELLCGLSLSKRTQLEKLIYAAIELAENMDRQDAYTKELQAIAAKARKTGKSQRHLIQPRAYDIGGPANKVKAAAKSVRNWWPHKRRAQSREERALICDVLFCDSIFYETSIHKSKQIHLGP